LLTSPFVACAPNTATVRRTTNTVVKHATVAPTTAVNVPHVACPGWFCSGTIPSSLSAALCIRLIVIRQRLAVIGADDHLARAVEVLHAQPPLARLAAEKLLMECPHVCPDSVEGTAVILAHRGTGAGVGFRDVGASEITWCRGWSGIAALGARTLGTEVKVVILGLIVAEELLAVEARR